MAYLFKAGLSRIAFMFLAMLLPITFIAGCEKLENRPKMKIGYMNCNNEQETTGRFLPMTRYLSEKTGVDFEFVPVDTNDFDKRFKAGEFAFTHSNSILYVMLKEHYDLILLASEKRGQFGSRTAGTIIARKDSGIKKLSDLRGKRIAFGPMLAPTGYMAEYDLMLRNGIDPEKDLANWTIPNGSYKHEKVIFKVLYGEVDAAAAPILDLEIMTREGKISPDDFIILGQSPLIPYCTFGAAKNTDPKLVEKVRQALLALKPTDTVEISGERVKIMKAAWIDGFEELADKDYDVIREMAKRVNMPPYQKF
ncbi:tetrathionate sensor histidine kinase TtrS [Geobacter sp. OR-1]|uniref:phosphate/phosphite/phosphonate ABC transporter substrate-binding protein n=1 Tax=Geobacter sp. OR-1 TaxID=1266765 RepID=UPI000544193C|nr:phosphate/phosphite/phosphonate ABC transporter substrate-binding protein [Geobacter sp. OR-1]GAM08339.1 tetrathionate sensor histidine kinase TtrS [Geobacter sp. OR-1]